MLSPKCYCHLRPRDEALRLGGWGVYPGPDNHSESDNYRDRDDSQIHLQLGQVEVTGRLVVAPGAQPQPEYSAAQGAHCRPVADRTPCRGKVTNSSTNCRSHGDDQTASHGPSSSRG